MKAVIGLALAFALGFACRAFGIPSPAPPVIMGALFVVAMTAGYIRTPAGDPNPAITARYAMGRHAQPEELAAAILFLTSDESSFMTGIALPVDGGRTFH